MKRSSFTISPDFGRSAAMTELVGETAINWTMMFAVTVATLVSGMVWFA